MKHTPPPKPPGPGLKWVRIGDAETGIDPEVAEQLIQQALEDLREQLAASDLPPHVHAQAMELAEKMMRSKSAEADALALKMLRH
jgi:Glu-tRNA(Gln) amidotransferase subunit E-like FAD-binding protein